MNEAKSSDVDISTNNNVEENVDLDAGEGEGDGEGKETERVTLRVKKKSPQEKKAEKRANFKQASDDISAGKFKNVRQAAQAYNLTYGCLWYGMVKGGGELQGSGRFPDTMGISKGRQDTSRVWNTDKTAIELGFAKKRVLAQRGIKVLYNVSSSTRDHITCVLTVSAAGEMVPPMAVFRGVRNVATERLALLPKDGKSGAWSLQSTEKGFITSEKFILVLQDLVKVLEEKQVERPVILFMDGATPHISLAMAEFCKTQGIQPWLFKPNTTHLTQP